MPPLPTMLPVAVARAIAALLAPYGGRLVSFTLVVADHEGGEVTLSRICPRGQPLPEPIPHMPTRIETPELCQVGAGPSTPAVQEPAPENLPAGLTELERDIVGQMRVIPRPLKPDAISRRMGRGKANSYFHQCCINLKLYGVVEEADEGGLWLKGRLLCRSSGVGS